MGVFQTIKEKIFGNKNYNSIQEENKSFESVIKLLENELHNEIEKPIQNKKSVKSNKIWILWYQGFENSPPIVKICLQSIKQTIARDYELILLTSENIHQYVSLPPEIENKVKEGIISMQHFSDLIRLNLLVEYGGLWLDSTILCTGTKLFDEVIKDCSFFSFKSDMFKDGFSGWFVYSDSHNPILTKMLNLMYAYWDKYDHLIHYFLIDIMFIISAKHFPDDFWHHSPNYHTEPIEQFCRELQNGNNVVVLKRALASSDFHKLNWHIDDVEKIKILNELLIEVSKSDN